MGIKFQIERLSLTNGDSFDNGNVDFKHCMSATWENTLRLFHVDLRKVTLLMIFITFSIQFG